MRLSNKRGFGFAKIARYTGIFRLLDFLLVSNGYQPFLAMLFKRILVSIFASCLLSTTVPLFSAESHLKLMLARCFASAISRAVFRRRNEKAFRIRSSICSSSCRSTTFGFRTILSKILNAAFGTTSLNFSLELPVFIDAFFAEGLAS